MSKIGCPQNQCSFNGICVGRGRVGCQVCEECGCEPNVIDENCDKCLRCSRESGELRWGEGEEKVVEKIAEVIKEIVNK